MTLLGGLKTGLQGLGQQVESTIKANPGATALLGAGAAAGLGTLGAVVATKAVKKAHRKTKAKAKAKKASAKRHTAKKSGKAKKTAKHKPRARGGVHNGHRVLIAKNGTRYIKLKSGKVRFIK